MSILTGTTAILAPNIAPGIDMPVISEDKVFLKKTENHPNTSNNAFAEATAKWACEFFRPGIMSSQVSKADVAFFAADCCQCLGGYYYAGSQPDSCLGFSSEMINPRTVSKLTILAAACFSAPNYADIVFPWGASEKYREREIKPLGIAEVGSGLFYYDYEDLSPDYNLRAIADFINSIQTLNAQEFFTIFLGEVKTRIENDKWHERNALYVPFEIAKNQFGLDVADRFGKEVALQTCRDLLLSPKKADKPNADQYRPPNGTPGTPPEVP